MVRPRLTAIEPNRTGSEYRTRGTPPRSHALVGLGDRKLKEPKTCGTGSVLRPREGGDGRRLCPTWRSAKSAIRIDRRGRPVHRQQDRFLTGVPPGTAPFPVFGDGWHRFGIPNPSRWDGPDFIGKLGVRSFFRGWCVPSKRENWSRFMYSPRFSRVVPMFARQANDYLSRHSQPGTRRLCLPSV